MVENKTVLYAAIFIIIVLTIIYLIFVVFNINKQKKGEVVNDTTFDTMFWMGIVLIVAMSLILIWLIAVFFMGDSAIVTVSNVTVDAAQGAVVKEVVTTSQTVTPAVPFTTVPTTRVVPATSFAPTQVVPVSVTTNSVQQRTLDAVIAASGQNTYNPL